MKVILLIALLIGGAWAVGVRFHADFLQEYLPAISREPVYKFKLKNGEEVNGKIVSETQDSVGIDIGSGTVTFSKSEVAERAQVDSGQILADAFKGKPARPLLTYRQEDNVLLKFMPQWGKPPSSSKPSGGSGSFFPSSNTGVMAAQRIRAQAEQLKRDTEKAASEY